MNEQEKIYKSSQLNTSKESEKSISTPSTTKETYNMRVLQAKLDFGILSTRGVMQLQRTIGNRATMQLLNNYMNTSSLQKKEDRNNINEVDDLRNQVVQKAENNTRLPDNLKAGVENLSGISLDNVKVHYNSDKPAKIGALAYTKGTDIYVGPEQKKHLPHEAWHVVQQAQGRVQPTIQMQNFQVNDNVGLEKEADEMSGKINSMVTINKPLRIIGNSNTHMLQCKRIPLALNNMKIGDPIDEINNDTLACVPTHLWRYEAEQRDKSADKMAALENIQQGYRSIGMGIKYNFLSAEYVKNEAKGNNKTLDTIYKKYASKWPDKFKINGTGKGDTNKKKEQITNLLEKKTMPDKSTINEDQLRSMLDELRNMNDLLMTDPFRISLTAKYGNDTIKHTVEFSEGQKGYISHVEDTQANINSIMEHRPNYAGEYPGIKDGDSTVWKAIGALRGKSPTFSSIHHTTEDIDVKTQIKGINEISKRSKEQGIDAMTKVVAEGGRFDCVAKLNKLGELQVNSLFYTLNSTDHEYRVIRFDELWKHWSSYFHGKYGITDEVVAGELCKENIMKPRKDVLTEKFDTVRKYWLGYYGITDELHKENIMKPRKGVLKEEKEPNATRHNYNLDAHTVR